MRISVVVSTWLCFVVAGISACCSAALLLCSCDFLENLCGH